VVTYRQKVARDLDEEAFRAAQQLESAQQATTAASERLVTVTGVRSRDAGRRP
jgi:hypothetical protein